MIKRLDIKVISENITVENGKANGKYTKVKNLRCNIEKLTGKIVIVKLFQNFKFY